METAEAKWVLVVDDDEDLRNVVVETLQSAGYVAVAAPGGTAALRMIEAGPPALIISDLTMQEMSGRELLTSTRDLLGSSTPPFVFLTGVEASERTDIAEPVLIKPSAMDELLGLVGHHCRA